MNCPVCSSSSTIALTKDGFDYFRCSSCEFLFHRAETGKETTSFYDNKYWSMERLEALRREREDCFDRALELVYLSTIPVRNILDFGCGLGITVTLLRESLGLNAVGVDPTGEFEPSDFLHKMNLEELQQRYPAGYFDAIYSIEVFEHLEDPKRILTILNSLLKPGGKILINTGTQEYIQKYDPEATYIDPSNRGHISIYSLKAFGVLAGFLGLRASFLGDRKYVTLLGPPSNSTFPHPDNLQTLRRMGDWFVPLFTEYMRLVFVEEEFDKKSQWLAQLLAAQGGSKTRLRRFLAFLRENSVTGTKLRG
jgi:SAM-dependent methyltransferase